MGHTTFVAFSSSDSFVAETITDACRSSKNGETEYVPWNRNDTSGQPIERSILEWIEDADAFVADISDPNHNVTYEVGLAIGMGKPVRLVRAANKDRRLIEEIGLLHNLGHEDYSNRGGLIRIFDKLPEMAP
jgi:nucleoside 2-deoxyribosyltransferase